MLAQHFLEHRPSRPPARDLQSCINAVVRIGAFPLLHGPPQKKAKRTVVPEDRFDIFEHFFYIDEPAAMPTAAPNAYAANWFSGEAAPPSSSSNGSDEVSHVNVQNSIVKVDACNFNNQSSAESSGEPQFDVKNSVAEPNVPGQGVVGDRTATPPVHEHTVQHNAAGTKRKCEHRSLVPEMGPPGVRGIGFGLVDLPPHPSAPLGDP